MDGEKMECRVMEGFEREIIQEVFRDSVPRNSSIARQDFENFGYTADCAGCKAVLRGTTRQKHSDSCRKRMKKEMVGQEKVKKA